MKAYHEVNPNELGAVLQSGLIRTSRGDKGDDALIIKADKILDEYRPKELKDRGVSRDNNLYAIVATKKGVIDSTDGTEIALKTLQQKSQSVILELQLDPRECFVSDLDTYDSLKDAVASRSNKDRLEKLAVSYWHKLIPLAEFQPGKVNRPEIMITYNIPPTHITLVK